MMPDFPPLTGCPLRYRAIHQPTRTAIQLEHRAVSFLQLDCWVESCCRFYGNKGLAKGDSILFTTENALETVIVALACLRSQWLFCPLNPAFPQAQQSGYQQRIQATLKGHTINLTKTSALPESQLQPINIAATEIYTLVATSGTTGVPKAVAHSYKNHYYNALGAIQALPLGFDDTWLLSLPLFHVGGLAIVFRCLLAGATMALFERKLPLPEMLERRRVTHVSLVNTQLYRLVHGKLPLYDVGVRNILLGGGIASPTLVATVKDQGITVLTTYGMTEMASQICTGEPLFTERGVTSGMVLPGRLVSLSATGEILVRGETLAKGYYERGTVIPLVDALGWFHSGDKGRWISDQIQVFGRMDNMMISGGENIHPEEIEQALLSLPYIVQAVIVAKRHCEFGQRPFAFVQTCNGTINAVQIKEQLAGKIAGFKIPDDIHPFPKQAETSGIKINRYYLQKMVDSY